MGPSEASKPGDGIASWQVNMAFIQTCSGRLWLPKLWLSSARRIQKWLGTKFSDTLSNWFNWSNIFAESHWIIPWDSMRFQRSERSLWPLSSTVVSASRCHSNGPKIQHSTFHSHQHLENEPANPWSLGWDRTSRSLSWRRTGSKKCWNHRRTQVRC